MKKVWNQPYLETCCRSSLHRLCLTGASGRPSGLRDDPCLERMQKMGFVQHSPQGRFLATDAGYARYRQEVLGMKRYRGGR
ncbi:hypothetical protein [Acetobacter thailandicus]|uniref:hypothetical protein n=1 Tax=Acetobacter thailandicus TaxID=1502842 RepID=UPI001BA97B11|nr:hypothetical protein [Acetobacter thailandicus]MBS0985075.1 hypothetical protein [Acetobacter thailandicus]